MSLKIAKRDILCCMKCEAKHTNGMVFKFMNTEIGLDNYYADYQNTLACLVPKKYKQKFFIEICEKCYKEAI